jgi:hypothetical protein
MAKQQNPRIPQLEAAKRIYKSFHGVDPEEALRVQVTSRTIPETLIVIGKAVAVEYEVEGKTPSQRKGKVYRHEFGDTGNGMVSSEVYLATDVTKKTFYLVNAKPGKLHFSNRGIIA